MDENLGDAVFVDSNNLVTNIDEIVDEISGEQFKFVSSEYFSNSRITRNSNYAEQMEMYERIINESTLEEQRLMASSEIKRINDEKNAISIAENLIKLKGIEDVVIFINDESVNVVVQNDKISEAHIAQIQNIIENELGVEAENVHINELNAMS